MELSIGEEMKRMISYLREKLHTPAGESLIETLVALLIAAMGMMVLPGAIISAARANRAAADAYTYMNAVKADGSDSSPHVGGFSEINIYPGTTPDPGKKVSIKVESMKETNQATDDAKAFYYYKIEKE